MFKIAPFQGAPETLLGLSWRAHLGDFELPHTPLNAAVSRALFPRAENVARGWREETPVEIKALHRKAPWPIDLASNSPELRGPTQEVFLSTE